MFTKISCAMLMLTMVTAVSSNTSVSGQDVSSRRNLKPKVTIRRDQPSRTTVRGGVKVSPPRRQLTNKKPVYKRRISVSELQRRLNALNGQQSGARKASTKPIPQKTPVPKSICDQYRDLVHLIHKAVDEADSAGRDAEAEALSQLANRAEIDARRHGCGFIYLVPTRPGGLMIDKFKVLKVRK